ncbi:MAG TPA: hypothetical protein VJN71_02240 [Nitrososphaerales archaeon]|nr:hypothetical protein [Nitrososphaerales archaeon]
MVDTTTLVVISTIVQTIVITITLLVFILQFRSQEKSIREASYQGLMGRYNDLMLTLVENPETAMLMMAPMVEAQGNAPKMTKEDAALFGQFLLAFGIIEEAFLLYKRKWMDEDTWLQWSAFLEGLAAHPRFAKMASRTRGTFDRDFEAYVSKMILKEEK